mmetsp:Transcript_33965/g.63400  ORF Transcript_33965/g.63400 Transcript_33965/m.63400 type:complete len:84 (-) Transcript_33965:3645-3896(-)
MKSRESLRQALTILIAVVCAVIEESDVGVRLAGNYIQSCLAYEWGEFAPLVVAATCVVVAATVVAAVVTRPPTLDTRQISIKV